MRASERELLCGKISMSVIIYVKNWLLMTGYTFSVHFSIILLSFLAHIIYFMCLQKT